MEPPGDEEALELRRFVWALFKRRWQILIVVALVVIPVAIWTAFAERLYRSSALVQIDPEPVQVLPYREIDLPSLTPNYEMFMKSQEQVLRGPTLVAHIADSLRKAPDAATVAPEIPRLWNRLSIQRLENTQIFRLSYVAPDPAVAARVANAFAEEYIKLHFESRQKTREDARNMLRRELDGLEQKVNLSEEELVAYAQKNNIPAGDASQSLTQQKLALLAKQLADAEGDVFAAQSRVESLRAVTVDNFPERLVTPVISNLVSRLTQLEHDMTALRATFGENWPAVVQKRSEIALVRDQLTRERTAALAQAREQAAVDLGAAESKRKMVADSMDEQKALANQLEQASIQYNIIRREVDTNQKMFEGLLQRLQQTSVTSGMEFGGFRVVEPALPSTEVDSPKTKWNLSLALLLGLALGVSIALVRDYWDSSIASVEEVEHLTVLPVLGTLPLAKIPGGPHTVWGRGARWLPASARGVAGRVLARLPRPGGAPPFGGIVRLTGASDPPAAAPLPATDAEPAPATGRFPRRRFASDRVAEEGVRNVCASLLLSRSGRPPRVLMVTSAVPGEGKSTLVSELGHALADSGSGTLLVECDLRRPSFRDLFGVGAENGLSLFLSGHVSPTPKIHPTANSNLFVVAAGPPAPNPPVLLGSEKMAWFLREMMSSFRFVIIDAPPVLPMADARVLAPMVEGVVLVVRAGHVAKPLVRRVSTLLEATGASVIGAVLNGADLHGPESPYYKYYKGYYDR